MPGHERKKSLSTFALGFLKLGRDEMNTYWASAVSQTSCEAFVHEFLQSSENLASPMDCTNEEIQVQNHAITGLK